MKTMKNEMVIYAVISFVAVAFVIAMDVTFYAYKQFHFFPKLAVTLYVITPIFASILSYIKISMQKSMPVRFSRIINITIVILFLVEIIAFYPLLSLLVFGTMAFYPPMGIFTLIPRNIMTTFFFCLQVCALAYDLFFRRNKEV